MARDAIKIAKMNVKNIVKKNAKNVAITSMKMIKNVTKKKINAIEDHVDHLEECINL